MAVDYERYERRDSAYVLDICRDRWRDLDAEYIALRYEAQTEQERTMWAEASRRLREQFYGLPLDQKDQYIAAMKRWDDERDRILAALEAGDTDIRPML